MSTGFDRLRSSRKQVLEAMLAAGFARQQLHNCLAEQAFPEDVYTKLRDDSDKMWLYGLKFDGRTLDEWTRAKPDVVLPQGRGVFAVGGLLTGLLGAGASALVYNKYIQKKSPDNVPQAEEQPDKESKVDLDIIELKDATETLKSYNSYNSNYFMQNTVQPLKKEVVRLSFELLKTQRERDDYKFELDESKSELVQALRVFTNYTQTHSTNVNKNVEAAELRSAELQAQLRRLEAELAANRASLEQKAAEFSRNADMLSSDLRASRKALTDKESAHKNSIGALEAQLKELTSHRQPSGRKGTIGKRRCH